jgi:hypothetical protein
MCIENLLRRNKDYYYKTPDVCDVFDGILRGGEMLEYCTEPIIVNLLRSPGIDSQPGGIVSSESIPGILKR